MNNALERLGLGERHVIVDVHAHHNPESYRIQTKEAGGSFQNRFAGQPDGVTMEARFAMMAEAGVARQILSPTNAPYSHDRDLAAHAARHINDLYADLRKAWPSLFEQWVSLPMPHVDQALVELRHGLDDLGGLGVVLGCSCLGESIASPAFEPVYAELHRRKAVVFLHPCQSGIGSPHINDYGLTVCAGASLEDSVAAMHLILARIPERYPDIRFIVPHFGGILPVLLNRLDGQMPQQGFAEKPSVTAKRFYYDTVGWGSRAALIAAVEAFGATQIVTGSDFPILMKHESYADGFDHVRNSGLPQDQIDLILGNAARLLELG
jgi:6-methylsalicylate decarboxylase